MSEIVLAVTDVKFRIGRGYAVGRVVNVDETHVDIRTKDGYVLRRKRSAVEVVAQPEPAATPAEAN